MGEPKPLASLTSSLLARKGAARPAMRPQTVEKMGSGGWEDLGWNDMGDIPVEPDASGHRTPSSITGLTPSPIPQNVELPPVVEQQRAIEQTFAPSAPAPEETAEEEIAESEPAADESAWSVDPQAEYDEGEAAILGGYEPVEDEASGDEDEAADDEDDAPEAFEPAQPRAEVVELPIQRPEASHGGAKAAFTLRLDEERHLKLRLACAVQNRSAQRIVCGALDAYLNSLPELDTLAEQVPGRRAKRR